MKPFSAPITDPVDIAYIEKRFARFDTLCARYGRSLEDVRREIENGELPHPTYGLSDGTLYVPASYFEHACTFDEFAERFARAAEKRELTFSPEEVQEIWGEWLSGGFGLCLREPSPETIVEKVWLIQQLDRLLATPRPNDGSWKAALTALVDQLDQLEAAFTSFDRERYGPVTRQRYIEALRERYDLPAAAAALS